ncbi:MAG TPA: MFS transporter [Gammaproteobacteria bacterium]|nr:MFS transporter [Gammaproteobacteria bacterium]
MFDRRPTGLQAFTGHAGEPIARLNACEGFARSLLVGIIPLLALEALGSKEMVTRAYLAASILTLLITLNFAGLERLLQRRWVLTLGVGCTLTAIVILVFGEGWVMSIAIGLQSAAASLFSVCLSLYIMDYIGKKELIFTESKRLFYTGIAWMIGPVLGVWLWEEVNHWAPFLLSACAASTMLAYFWYLRLGQNQVIQKAQRPSINILRIIPRFFAQSSLRIAYWITLSRSIFWMTVFIYAPIYVVESGLSNWVAGMFLSLVSSLLIASPLIRRLAGRYGTRPLIVYALWLTGVSMAMLFFIGAAKPIGLLFWVVASLGGAIVDVLGNIPFMRMVKPRERTEMTMIFSTWREGSQLLTPLLVSMVLLVAPFEAYYLLLAAILISAAIVATFLPGRL